MANTTKTTVKTTTNKPAKRKNQSFARELYSDIKNVVKEHPLISLFIGYKAATALTKPRKTETGEETASTLKTVTNKLTDDSTLIILVAIGAVAYLFKNV